MAHTSTGHLVDEMDETSPEPCMHEHAFYVLLWESSHRMHNIITGMLLLCTGRGVDKRATSFYPNFSRDK